MIHELSSCFSSPEAGAQLERMTKMTMKVPEMSCKLPAPPRARGPHGVRACSAIIAGSQLSPRPWRGCLTGRSIVRCGGRWTLQGGNREGGGQDRGCRYRLRRPHVQGCRCMFPPCPPCRELGRARRACERS